MKRQATVSNRKVKIARKKKEEGRKKKEESKPSSSLHTVVVRPCQMKSALPVSSK
jgi:hypothetical protein